MTKHKTLKENNSGDKVARKQLYHRFLSIPIIVGPKMTDIQPLSASKIVPMPFFRSSHTIASVAALQTLNSNKEGSRSRKDRPAGFQPYFPAIAFQQTESRLSGKSLRQPTLRP
ncbi:hypothetical protein [Parabacteroides johnsonii]